MAMPGVRGVGIGLDESGTGLALVVFGEKLTNEFCAAIPRTVEGKPVRLIKNGFIVAH